MDHRYRGRSAKALRDCAVLDDNENEIQLPTKFEICPTCEGRGHHVNPAIDDNGITSDHYRGYAILLTPWAESKGRRWYIMGGVDEQYQYKYRTLEDAKAAIDRHCEVAEG